MASLLNENAIMPFSLIEPQQVIKYSISIILLHFLLLLHSYNHYTLHIHPFTWQNENVYPLIHSLSTKSEVLLNTEWGQSKLRFPFSHHEYGLNQTFGHLVSDQLLSQSVIQCSGQSGSKTTG